MTTLTIRSPDEYPTTTTRSAYPSTPGVADAASEPAVTYFKHVLEETVPPREGFIDADDFLAEVEQDLGSRDDLIAARHAIAKLVRDKCDSPLTAMRLSAGLSQRELAKIMKTTQSYISRIECNGGDLVISTLERLSKALRVDVTEVFHAVLYLRKK
jgi:hypothetical protein